MYPFERFTEDAKKVLTLAQHEAERSHHSYIGTEHLLLGLIRSDGAGGRALRALKIDEGKVRRVIENVLGRNERILIQQLIPTSRVKRVIELAFEEGSREGGQYVDSGHLLIALSVEAEGIAAHVLQDLGASEAKVRAAVRKIRKDVGTSVTPAPSNTDAESDVLRRLIQVPHLARLLESKGLDVDAVVVLLSRPPDQVVNLRRFVADLRAELKDKVDASDFEAAARLQKGEKELLTRLAAAEKEWIDGL